VILEPSQVCLGAGRVPERQDPREGSLRSSDLTLAEDPLRSAREPGLFEDRLELGEVDRVPGDEGRVELDGLARLAGQGVGGRGSGAATPEPQAAVTSVSVARASQTMRGLTVVPSCKWRSLEVRGMIRRPSVGDVQEGEL